MQTYVWVDSEERLAKEEWNFEEFVKEKIGGWTGQSDEFRDVDALGTGGMSAWDGEAVGNAG